MPISEYQVSILTLWVGCEKSGHEETTVNATSSSRVIILVRRPSLPAHPASVPRILHRRFVAQVFYLCSIQVCDVRSSFTSTSQKASIYRKHICLMSLVQRINHRAFPQRRTLIGTSLANLGNSRKSAEGCQGVELFEQSVVE